MGMKQLLLICAVVVLAGCGEKPLDPIFEKVVRIELKKPEGELTKADLEEVKVLCLDALELTKLPRGLEKCTELTSLSLTQNELTDFTGLENLTQLKVLSLMGNKLTEIPKGLEKLTKLEVLWLKHNPDLTKAQIDELQKALPNCGISSNPTK